MHTRLHQKLKHLLSRYGQRTIVLFLLVSILFTHTLGNFALPTKAAFGPWTQTDWSGGSGQTLWSDNTKFDSSSNLDLSASGQASLELNNHFTNAGFESNLSGWITGAQPDSIADLQLWLKADAITGLDDGDQLTTWEDSSSNGYDATQTTADKKPTYKTNIMNEKPVIRGDGINDRLGLPSAVRTILNSKNYTYFVVFDVLTPGTHRGIFGNYHNSDRAVSLRLESISSWEVRDKNTVTGSYGSDPIIVTGGADGITLEAWLNGASQGTAVPANSGILGETSIFDLVDSGGTTTLVGANADIAEIILYDSLLLDTDRSDLEYYLANKWGTAINGGPVTRDTSTVYEGDASAKVVTSGSTHELTQSVSVGDTNSYQLVVHAYTDGGAVTNSDVELYYNGSTVSTTYTSVGSGWYKLSGTVTGADESRDYGVQVKANKTAYVDKMRLIDSLTTSGTLTSSIFDTEQESSWGVLVYNAETPTDTSVTVKVRSSNSATMTGATNFSSCDAIASGVDISSNNCITDTHRYIQYQLTLANTDSITTPIFEDISISFFATSGLTNLY